MIVWSMRGLVLSLFFMLMFVFFEGSRTKLTNWNVGTEDRSSGPSSFEAVVPPLPLAALEVAAVHCSEFRI